MLFKPSPIRRSPFARLIGATYAIAASLPIAASGDFAVTSSTPTGSSSTGGATEAIAAHAVGLSSFGDHASGVLSFNLVTGVATVTAHACSAPQNGIDPAGFATGGAFHEQITFAYSITSETLPPGTPVTLQVCVAASRSMSAIYVPPLVAPPFDDYADSGLNLTVAIAGQSFTGNAHQIAFNQSTPDDSTYTGLFLEGSSDNSVTLTRTVGDIIALQLTFSGYAHSRAMAVGAFADGHVSSSVLFGASVIGADAQVRSLLDGSLFPGCGGCTAEEAANEVPPPPPLGPCYNGQCPDGYYCATPIGECDAPGVCLPIPTGCRDADGPVCGCDNRNFGSACEAAAVGVSVAHLGPCSYRQTPDLDGDGLVGGSDLAILLGSWGECPSRGRCDGDVAPAPEGDGVVNGADLAVLLGSWSTG